MKCSAWESRVHELLDLRRPPEEDAEVADHVRACGECRELLAALAAVAGELERLPLPAPRADLSRRVADELAAVPKVSIAERRRPGAWWRLAAAAATAAAVWFALGLPGIQRQPADIQPPDLAESGLVPNQGAEADAIDAAWIAGTTLRQLHEQTRESLALALLAVPGLGGPPAEAEPPTRQDAAWGQDVRDTLAPVTQSTAGALDALWQTLVPGKDSTS